MYQTNKAKQNRILCVVLKVFIKNIKFGEVFCHLLSLFGLELICASHVPQ